LKKSGSLSQNQTGRQVKLHERIIPYKPVFSKKAKHIRLQITAGRELEVIIPRRANIKEAENFILKKFEWVNKHLTKPKADNKPLLMGKEIKINQHYDLFIPKHKFFFRKGKLDITSPSGSSESPKYLYNVWLKHSAKKFITKRTEQISKKLGFVYNKISIRGQKTRWGSCSAKGTLSFNYKLIRFRKEVIDYLIIHELCHLKEMNHSKNFWRLVEKFCPDFKALEKELKKS
jgi:predicted metal-dependent hydrolase